MAKLAFMDPSSGVDQRGVRRGPTKSSDSPLWMHLERDPKILELVNRFQTDVVEIVGHTDEQPIPSGIPSTLDTLSIDVIAKGEPASRLDAADNAGLGFARALLKSLTVLPLSAAQVIDVDGKLS
jgi:hypothetical protein